MQVSVSHTFIFAGVTVCGSTKFDNIKIKDINPLTPYGEEEEK